MCAQPTNPSLPFAASCPFPPPPASPGLACPHHAAGDVLFIPSLWFHNVLTMDAPGGSGGSGSSSSGGGWSASINVFWRHLPDSFYERKDLYGNTDLVEANQADKHVEAALQLLEQLPPHYRSFYTARLMERFASASAGGGGGGPGRQDRAGQSGGARLAG